jgi:hypothetical protein
MPWKIVCISGRIVVCWIKISGAGIEPTQWMSASDG